MSDQDKKALMEKAHGAIILGLADKVLRKVSKGENNSWDLGKAWRSVHDKVSGQQVISKISPLFI